MDNRGRHFIIILLISMIILLYSSLLVLVSSGSSDPYTFAFLDRLRENGLVEASILLACTAIVAIFIYEFVLKLRNDKKYKEEYQTHADINTLNTLLVYSQKRKEIEQEISRLTNALSHSDVNEYLNINRLVFAGQSGIVGNGLINYDQFFNQFGIDKDSIEIKKGTAVFLTPFNQTSNKLFSVCSSVLNKMGILLQRTDNTVEKDDIMMNIVSHIVQAEFLIVNIDGRNPNVYYELGIAHAIGKPTILISETSHPETSIGFDIRQKQIVLYKDDIELEKELLYQVNRIRNK